MIDPNCNDQRIYIGRLGYEVELECIEAWDISGDTARIKGALVSTSVEEALVLRQQLNGYIGNLDEDVIPIVWNAHPAMNGFYGVKGGDVNFAGSSLRSGIFDFSLEVERVASSAGPLFESVITGAARINSHGFTGNLGWLGLPSAAVGLSGNATLRPSATGDPASVWVYDSLPPSVVSSFWLPPQNYIDGAAQILYGDAPAGSPNPDPILATYRTIVGQQIANEPRQWLLSNGIIRCFWDGTEGSGLLRFQAWHEAGGEWRGGAAGTSKDFTFTDLDKITGTNRHYLTQVNILRNTPEECAVRLTFNAPAVGGISIPGYKGDVAMMDITLRRGARFVAIHISWPGTPAASTSRITIARAVPEAASNAIVGIKALTGDAGGIRYVLATPQLHSQDTTNGTLTETDADNTVTDYMVALEVGADYSTADITDYMHAASEKILVGA